MDPFSFLISTVIQLGISYIFPSEGPRLKDTKISASTYGAFIPWTYGVTRVPGNMIWSEPIQEHKLETLPGKGGFVNEYTYTCSFAMGCCRGEVIEFRRVWADGKIIYDISGLSELAQKEGVSLRFYRGTEDQFPDPLIEADRGEGNTPAYRGLAYIVFDTFPLTDYGNRIPQITVEVFAQANGGGLAPSTSMTTLEGSPLPNTGESGMTVDVSNGFIYVPDTSNGGLQRVRTSDGVKDMDITNEMMAFPDTTNYSDTGNIKRDNQLLNAVIAISPTTGYLLVQHGFNNNVAIDILNPYTYAAIATSGCSSPFGSLNPNFPGGPYVFDGGEHAISITGDKTEWGAWRGAFGLIQAAPIDPKRISEGFTVGTVGDHTTGVQMVGTYGDDNPTFYFVIGGHADGTHTEFITIEDIDGNVLGTLSNPENPPAPQLSFGIVSALWDIADPGIVLLFSTDHGTWAAKWSRDTGEIVWVTPTPAGFNGGRDGFIQYAEMSFIIPTSAGLDRQVRWYSLDTRTGRWNDGIAPFDGAREDESADDILDTAQSAYTGVPLAIHNIATADQFYDSYRGVVVSIGGGTSAITKLGSVIEDTNLGSICESVLRAGGLTASQMDMSRLYDTAVMGYGWARGTDIKAILDELRHVYSFDIVESQGKLIGVLRQNGFSGDGSAATTIVQDALGSSSADVADFWQQTRIQEADLPESVTLAYMNFDNDYETGVARSQRISNPNPTMFSHQQVAMQVSIVMHPQEAKDRMNAVLYSQWAERVKYDTRLPWAYLDLDPADLVEVDMNDSRSFFTRLDSTEIGADYSIAAHLYSQDSGAYVSNGATADGGGVGSQSIPFPVAARPFVVNTPLLRDEDDTNGSFSRYYAGLGNSGAGRWNGADMWRSLNRVDYYDLFGEDVEVEWGVVIGAVPKPSRGNFALDWKTKITLWAVSADFELSPITDDELWAGGNPCLIGDEVMQYRDCVQNDDGSWTIWNLLRGRRGTEYACDTHKAGETFLTLDPATLTSQGDTLDSRGQERDFKAVGTGRSLVNAQTLLVVYEPRDMMPYAPSDIRREIVTGNTVEVTWKRRTRMGGNMMDFTGSVPLHETNETYEVYFLADAFAGDLSRGNAPDSWLFMTTTNSPTVTWTPESTSVFDVDLDTLHVVIYQLSSAVGRGFPGTRSIEPWQDF